MRKSLLLAGAAVLALSSAATAATFSVIDGVRGVIPEAGETNEVLENVFGMGAIAGFFGGEVLISEAATINVNYFGYEAGFTNRFDITGTSGSVDFSTGAPSSLFAADAATPIASETLDVAGGSLDFSFSTLGAFGVDPGTAANDGSNPDNTEDPALVNFFASLSLDAKTVFLFFDDTGAGDDDNHDDFVVSLSIGPAGQEPEPVPLPAGGLLLLGGLGAFAVARRRKNKA